MAWRRRRLVDRDLPFVGLAGALDELARAVAGPEGLAGLVRRITAEAPLLGSLGAAAPEGAAGTALATLPALLSQLRHRLRPGRGGGAEARRAELLIASQVHERLAEMAYFDARLVPVLNHTLHALKYAFWVNFDFTTRNGITLWQAGA